MRRFLTAILICFASLLPLCANAPEFAVFEDGESRTLIADGKQIATLAVDSGHEWQGVKWAVENLSEDFARVTGRRAPITGRPAGATIIIGTIGRGGFIEDYLSPEDLASLQGAREKYILKAPGDGTAR